MTDPDTARIHERLDDLVRSTAKRDGQFDECIEMLKRHETTLHGNSHKGLVTRIATLESQTAKMPGLGGGVIGVKTLLAIIAAVCAGVGGAIQTVLATMLGH